LINTPGREGRSSYWWHGNLSKPLGPVKVNNADKRPAWLDNAHRELDAAVAAAYGWPEDIGEEDALARLLELNRERPAARR
jgi:hypothetical protein